MTCFLFEVIYVTRLILDKIKENIMKTYKLSDSTIAQLAKLLQVALLTGTDVVDNLRTMELIVEGDLLEPSQEFLEQNEENVR